MHSTTAIFSPSTQHSPPPSCAPAYTPDSSAGYFGLSLASDGDQVTSSGARALSRPFSGHSSSISIRSAAASPPHNFAKAAPSDFEAFRRSSESRVPFSLNQGGLSQYGITPRIADSKQRSSQDGQQQQQLQSDGDPRGIKTPPSSSRSKPSAMYLAKADSAAAGEIPRSPKRVFSNDGTSLDRRPSRRESSGVFMGLGDMRLSNSPTRNEDKHPRLSPPQRRSADDPVPCYISISSRGETLPTSLDSSGPSMITPERVVNILDSHAEEVVLLLDLRVYSQYARSRIESALNLCVPSTLLKRPAYDVSKLADTFKDETQKQKFQRWKTCRSIIVYDTSSSKPKEALGCFNILKKFANEGWAGDSHIIQGGFAAFGTKFSRLVVKGDDRSSSSCSRKGSSPERSSDSDDNVAPVIGGCPMPATSDPVMPFFGNIRQNTDLIGGVGQMSIQRPSAMNQPEHYRVPAWLRKAVDEHDKGKAVSEKFEQIERREKKRMEEALSTRVSYGSPRREAPGSASVQLAGLEKGSKNRYNNIWPYEHSRVKLAEIPVGGCDYVNASYVGAALSNKRYIATQGPIPATFADFWKVVWQHDIRVIVMLTAEMEGAQIKAHNYWKERRYGPIKVNFLSEHRASLEPSKIQRHRAERPGLADRRAFTAPGKPNPKPGRGSRLSTDKSHAHANGVEHETETARSDAGGKPSNDSPFVIVRKFTIAHEEQPFKRMREITQLQYTSWPDFGAPAKPAHLLGLVEQCEAVVKAGSGEAVTAVDEPEPPSLRPVLVHCSAGCGRTGTFVTVASVIDMLKRQLQGTNAQSARYSTSMDVDHVNGNGALVQPGGSLASAAAAAAAAATSPVAASPTVDANWLKGEDVDLICKTVEELRLQRLSMVQSLRQFVLCYETVLEWVVSLGPTKPSSTSSFS